MSLSSIRVALETRLAALADLPATGWENTSFEPPDEEAHLLVYVLPAETSSPTVGHVEMTRESGILQVAVRAPANRGTREALLLAERVREHFPKGLGLIAGGVSVKIARRGSVTPARQEAGWYRIDLSIPYFANVFHAT